jgi:hypothetical protein
MTTHEFSQRVFLVFVLILLPMTVIAQQQRDLVPLKPWSAPLRFQPSSVDRRFFSGLTADVGATSVSSPLVFVAITPCRLVDTRTGAGFNGPFGPPGLLGGVSRTFPILSSPDCSIPPSAQAYSFNITVVPPGFLSFLTAWPTGQPRPNASTLNGFVATVIANAAVVPAGAGGSVDVFASDNTNLIIDINGYYVPESIALTVTVPGGTTIASSNCIAQTVPAPGSVTSMAVVMSPNGDPNSRGLSKVIWRAYVSGTDQITAEFCRFGSGAAFASSDQVFNIRVLN